MQAEGFNSKHMPPIYNVKALSRPVFKCFQVINQNQFPYGEKNGIFTSRTQLLQNYTTHNPAEISTNQRSHLIPVTTPVKQTWVNLPTLLNYIFEYFAINFLFVCLLILNQYYGKIYFDFWLLFAVLHRMSSTFIFFWLGASWIDSWTKTAEEVGTHCCTLLLLSWIMKCYKAVFLNEIRGNGRSIWTFPLLY